MPSYTRSYTSDHDIGPDDTVSFSCSQDVSEWPWLALPPQHPIPLQAQNFWAAVGGGKALQSQADDRWSALTWTRWELGDLNAGIAARGTYQRVHNDDELRFGLKFFDQSDRLIASLDGKGVIFRTRNFEKWRDESKEVAEEKSQTIHDFSYAPRELLALTEHEVPLIAALEGGPEGQSTGQSTVQATSALITKENGLPPAHRYFSGSGDHVNSTHLAEVARQTACLLSDGAPLHLTKGAMTMRRYVELGTPFTIKVASHEAGKARLEIGQLGKICAEIEVNFAPI
jgi:hypothetical protein